MRELSLHILDVLQNAIEAGATRIQLCIDEDLHANVLRIVVEDNGRGMSEDLARRVLDPFVTTRTTRHVGLGLPLLAAAAERSNGGVQIKSRPGEGTTITATFQHNHIDRAPLGDLSGTLMAVFLSQQSVDVYYRHTVDDRVFELDTAEIREELVEVPLTHPAVREWLQRVITEGLDSLERPQP